MAYPIIPPVREAGERPLWSVMIPTFNPRRDYLERTLEGVLAQLAGRDDVQIEIVDDGSTEFDPEVFLGRIDADGVGYHRGSEHRGIAGNWNRCIQRARGHWVHLLHQDDYVLPGFYDAMRRGALADDRIGAVFCTSFYGDHLGGRSLRRSVSRRPAGVLGDWVDHVFVRLAIQTCAIVVRRTCYEELGGFDDDFSYALDWDMWKRIAVDYPIWYEPRALACYRLHADSQTARLRRSGANIAELARSIDRSEALLPIDSGPEITRRARRAYAAFAVENAFDLFRSDGDRAAARAQLVEARKLSSPVTVGVAAASVVLRSLIRPAVQRLRSLREPDLHA